MASETALTVRKYCRDLVLVGLVLRLDICVSFFMAVLLFPNIFDLFEKGIPSSSRIISKLQ